MCTRPPKGCAISSMRKIAPETESEHTMRDARAMGFHGANKPKLPKMTVNQKTRISKNAVGSALPVCSRKSQRVCARSPLICRARDCSERWASSRA